MPALLNHRVAPSASSTFLSGWWSKANLQNATLLHSQYFANEIHKNSTTNCNLRASTYLDFFSSGTFLHAEHGVMVSQHELNIVVDVTSCGFSSTHFNSVFKPFTGYARTRDKQRLSHTLSFIYFVPGCLGSHHIHFSRICHCLIKYRWWQRVIQHATTSTLIETFEWIME